MSPVSVRFEQPLPDGRPHRANTTLNTGQSARPSVNLSGFDFSRPIKIVAEVMTYDRRYEPFVPPKRWEFNDVIPLAGGFRVDLSDFKLVGDN